MAKEKRKPKPFKYRGGLRSQVSMPDGSRPYKDFGPDEAEAAEKWIDAKLEEIRSGKPPELGGPENCTLAQALRLYASLYTVTKGGAKAELDRINHYLRGAQLPALKFVKKAEGFELLERTEKDEQGGSTTFKAHKQKRLDKRKGTYEAIGELARTRCSAITTVRIRSLAKTMKMEGLSDSTVQKEVALLKHFFNKAASEWNWKGFENPCTGVELKKSKHRFVVLPRAELAALRKALSECDSPYFWQLVETCLQTTMRLGSLLALSRSNVDLEGRIAYVPTKTGPMAIPLTRMAVELLRGLPVHPSGKYFPITGNAVDMAWDGVRTKMGRKDLQFRDLRHVAATELARAGANAHQLMRMLGHKNTRMAEVYVNLASMDMLEFLDGIESKVMVFELPEPAKGSAGQILKERRSKRLLDAAMKALKEKKQGGGSAQEQLSKPESLPAEAGQVQAVGQPPAQSLVQPLVQPAMESSVRPQAEPSPESPEERPMSTGTDGPQTVRASGKVVFVSFPRR
jgi:integrase